MLKGTGILTCFPFGVLRLRYVLGPTDPRLTNIAEEPWPLRRSGFSPDFAATATRIFVSAAVHDTLRRRFCPRRAPPYQITLRCSVVSVIGLAPSIFGALNLDW